MPYVDKEQALAYKRAWARANPRPRTRSERIEGEDSNWFVLTCQHCFRPFDVPKRRTGRLPSSCCRSA